MHFELQTQKLRKYLNTSYLLTWSFMYLMMFFPLMMVFIFEADSRQGLSFIFGLALLTAFGLAAYLRWFAKAYVKSLQYQLDNHILHVQEGVFNRKHKAIPLDRVTDFQLFQGILMRWIGIWIVKVQTASQGEATPEAVLWAVGNPQDVRNRLLTARNEAVNTQNPAINVA